MVSIADKGVRPKVVPAATVASSSTKPQSGSDGPKDWKLYDAVLQADSNSGHAEDEEMAKFMPMLNDSLKREHGPHRSCALIAMLIRFR